MRWLLICFTFLSLYHIRESTDDFEVKINLGGRFFVSTLRDSLGLIDGYRSDMKVPVCEDSVCYEVKLIINWNLIGEFDSFEILKDNPLTKLDHIPFTQADYKKLDKILKNKDLNFVKLSSDELMDRPKGPKVDGYSGATKTTIKNEVIEGALFTCYNLWHITNGSVVDSILMITANALNPPMVEKMLAKDVTSYHYFLLNRLSESDLLANLVHILDVIPRSEGYFAKNALERFPVIFYESIEMKDFIKSNFLKIDYYSQKALLNKLVQSQNSEVLNPFLLTQLNPQNTFHFQQIIQIILKNPSKEDCERLINLITQNKITLSAKNTDVLIKYKKRYNL